MECLTDQTMKRDLYPFRANYFKNHAGLAIKSLHSLILHPPSVILLASLSPLRIAKNSHIRPFHFKSLCIGLETYQRHKTL